MDFTREPIIETIITPKEGYKLVIRSSKSAGQEEYFVDAVEIVTFGYGLFYRSLERPKAFLVPVSDYEVLEVREARMVLKNAGLDRSIKIGGGREGQLKAGREIEKGEVSQEEGGREPEEPSKLVEVALPATEARPEVRVDKKRDRRKHYRKRKGREDVVKEETTEPVVPPLEDDKIILQPPEEGAETTVEEGAVLTPAVFSALLQPPPKLISETISQYRQNELFKGAFYLTEEEQYKPHDKVHELLNEDEEEMIPSLKDPDFVGDESVSDSFAEESEKNGKILKTKKSYEETENLKIEIDTPEEVTPFAFEENEESEPEAALPLYAEEDTDTSQTPMKGKSFFAEDEDSKKENSHQSHQE